MVSFRIPIGKSLRKKQWYEITDLDDIELLVMEKELEEYD